MFHVKPFDVVDHLVSKTSFRLAYDNKRKAWKTQPVLSEESLQAYYPNETYASHIDKATDVKSLFYMWIKKRNIKKKLSWLRPFYSQGKLLDFGAGNGAFALQAKNSGWDVSTYDASVVAKERLAHKKLNTTSIPLTDSYDVITLWHVFEHLPNPEEQLNLFFKALSPGGILVLALPNYDSWDAKHYGAEWAAYDVPRHLWHYNKEAVALMANETGFKQIGIRNMFWDAFYISLLSEQYRNSGFTWPLAFFKGLYSNVVGWNKKNTSSLVFLLQKPK